MRAFIGIRLDDCISNIVSIMDDLRQRDKTANYTLLNNIHITLEFLGEINELEIKKIEDIFSKIYFNSFEITLNKVSRFKNMIILGVKQNNVLSNLQGFINKELKLEGFLLENRKYFPHVTLARKSNLEINKDINLQSKVNEVILFSSERINNCLTYTPILRKKLEGEFNKKL